MTVSVQSPTVTYAGNGSLTTYPYTFRVDGFADLKIYFDGVLQGSGYSVTGLGVDSGGNVIFTVAPANGVAIRIIRKTVVERTTDYLMGGALISETLDRDLDRAIMMIQEYTSSAEVFDQYGNINLFGGRLTNVTTLNATDAATKGYVDGLNDKKVKVSTNDSSPGFLNGKLVAGTGVVLTENNDGGNENLTVSFYGTLNDADTVDGLHAAAFALSSHTHTKSQIVDFTEANYVKTTGDFIIGGNLTLNGNVSINGTLTTINATNLEVSDPEIILNDGEAGTGVTAGKAGITVDRGLATDARLVFDETDDKWKVDPGTASLTAMSLVGHTHVEADITNLQSYSLTGHAHAASSITSGTLDNARISQASVTQHQAALSITESQISNLQAYLLNINAQSIEALSDVATMTKATSDLLSWNGSTWTNTPGSTYALSGHNHTGVYSPVVHDHTGVYEPADATILKSAAIGVSVAAFSHTHASYLTDAPSNGNEYVRKNAAWSIASSGGATTLDGLTDVTIVTPADKHLLYYDNGTSQWKNGTAGTAGVLPLSGGTLTGGLSGTTIALSSYQDFAEIASPATPAASNVRLYAKADGKLYIKDDAGTETDLTAAGSGGGANYGTATLVFGAASLKNVDKSVTITGLSGIGSNSHVQAWIQGDTTAHHSADEHLVLSSMLSLVVGSVIAGTGFTIYGFFDGVCGLSGDVQVHYSWKT